MYKGLIPLLPDGTLINWITDKPPTNPCIVPGTNGQYDTHWVENREFYDKLKLVSYQRGRSSVVFKWKSENTSIIYEIGLSQSFEMLFHLKEMMCYEGKFVFVKRGQNYLLEPILTDQKEGSI